jgi:uncharacterized protein
MNYRTQVETSFLDVDRPQWQELWQASPHPTPFTHHAFLAAAETSGSANSQAGWRPCPITVRDPQDRLIAAAPLYMKAHSYGEYVFDWAWARAYQDAGLQYFPKWLIASPFSPVPGSRLLARDASGRAMLAKALTDLVSESGLSSAHLLFGSEEDHLLLREHGWLERQGVQFHWKNRGFRDFDDFLDSLSQPKRKKIRAERRKVAEAGIACQVREARSLGDEEWDFFYRCYENTYLAHGNPPYLSRAFFQSIAREIPEQIVIATAHPDHNLQAPPVAASLLMTQPTAEGQVAYGRYWGSLVQVSMLHFELAYYTPIEWGIATGVLRIEGGAQGEHKMARGFEPVPVLSSHWISEPRFRDAVARFLAREGQGMEGYLSELNDRLPFK